MATKKQIRANRLNALKSTGPKTAEGKRRVAMNSRLSTGPKTEQGKRKAAANSWAHGLSAAEFSVPEELEQAYAEHRRRSIETYEPTTPEEQTLVELISQSNWKMKIASLSETEILRNLIRDYGSLLLTEDPKAARRFFGISRYEVKASNNFCRALGQLREKRKNDKTK